MRLTLSVPTGFVVVCLLHKLLKSTQLGAGLMSARLPATPQGPSLILCITSVMMADSYNPIGGEVETGRSIGVAG